MGELCRRIGYTGDPAGAALSRYETGIRPLPLTRLMQLSIETGISLGMLVWPVQVQEYQAYMAISQEER